MCTTRSNHKTYPHLPLQEDEQTEKHREIVCLVSKHCLPYQLAISKFKVISKISAWLKMTPEINNKRVEC